MGGFPYWHVGLQDDSPNPHWKILDPFVAKHAEDYGYGKRWLSYAYKPAHIDREAWKPCEKCYSCDNCIFCDDRYDELCDECSIGFSYKKFEPFKYCKYCGRPLTDEAWDALEKRIG